MENAAGGLKIRNIQGLYERSSTYMGGRRYWFLPNRDGDNFEEKKCFHNPTGDFVYMVK